MKTIRIDITGNQLERTGNPIAYKRMLNHSWRADSTRYRDWQSFVRMSCGLYAGPMEVTKGETVEIDIAVVWANEKHPDLDNVVKGLLDSLVSNDKEVTSVIATCTHGKVGRVIGQIIIHSPQQNHAN